MYGSFSVYILLKLLHAYGVFAIQTVLMLLYDFWKNKTSTLSNTQMIVYWVGIIVFSFSIQ